MPRGPMMQKGMQAMPKVRKGTVTRLMKYVFEGYEHANGHNKKSNMD